MFYYSRQDWGCRSVVECLSNKCKDLNLISTTTQIIIIITTTRINKKNKYSRQEPCELRLRPNNVTPKQTAVLVSVKELGNGSWGG